MTYPVNNAVSEVGDENGKAVAWEKAFIQLVKVWALFFFLISNIHKKFVLFADIVDLISTVVTLAFYFLSEHPGKCSLMHPHLTVFK